MNITKPGVEFTQHGESAIYTLSNGNVIEYRRYEGVYYHATTPMEVVRVLAHARTRRQRIHLHLGVTDPSKPDVGRDWMEENDVEGYIGNSIGPLKVPLLIYNAQSIGGGAILDHCIVKITTTGHGKRTLFIHPKYSRPEISVREIKPTEADLIANVYTHAVCYDGETVANFKSIKAAHRFADKMV